MNPIITSLPGFAQIPGVQPQGGGVGDYPSFATVLPAYGELQTQPGESAAALMGETVASYGQVQEATRPSPQQQRQPDSPDSGEATALDLVPVMAEASQQGPAPQGRGADQSWPSPATSARSLPLDGTQPVSAQVTNTESTAAQSAQLNQTTQPEAQLAPVGGAVSSEMAVTQVKQTSVSQASGQLATMSLGTHSGDSLGAWRPLTGSAVTQVMAGELSQPVTDRERPTADAPAAITAQLAAGRGSQWGPLPLDASSGTVTLARQMLAPLKEQVRFSVDHGITKAEVRLDPPELGRIDLSVRHEGDRVTVQLTAANPAVREALALGAERLRSEMTQGLGGEVQVDVGQGAPQEKQQQPEYPGRSAPMMAAQDPAVDQPATERDLIDMLA
ncbi:flagellar hook-length control protein FliK [Ferrimonas sp. YFM]|uniref:flagellar hook-length control protein FliK n=1 Tax=Ferrimonas sp. YFM TaxID=3028878 RepID=UPI0025734FA6|nr:flagellar hook-length control protein FliK [Ferrimonas sp. YFM]BDY05665.1 hypothetical protein F0521_27060 [Ferrimonas sp. YFM]